ncbi:MAG: hypothetical protein M1451_00075 [Acidobacteria bacterium]|nr:hypothetical protein [Acidobacteriota bacterium]
MFPRNYFALFPPFPRENKVFVAMSFDDRFQPRWKNVIAPAIQNVVVNNMKLEPHRVDTRRIGDSILTEILGGVTNDLLVIADVTTVDKIDVKVIRNGNVMYEIGLAHSVRLPEEVLIFRSDSDHLLFDFANVRVNSYDPDGNPDEARREVSDAIVESLKELDLKRHLAVKAAAQALDFTCWSVLMMAVEKNGVGHFPTRKMREALGNAPNNAAVARLLEFGALETDYIKLAPGLIQMLDVPVEQLMIYKPTPFGRAVLEYMTDKMGGIPTET